MRWLRARLGMVAGERGSALVEFTFIAIVVFVPLVYIVAGFSAVQRGVFASTAAAREAGRAMGAAPDPVTGAARAEAAARLAVQGQSVEATDVRIGCGPALAPSLMPSRGDQRLGMAVLTTVSQTAPCDPLRAAVTASQGGAGAGAPYRAMRTLSGGTGCRCSPSPHSCCT